MIIGDVTAASDTQDWQFEPEEERADDVHPSSLKVLNDGDEAALSSPLPVDGTSLHHARREFPIRQIDVVRSSDEPVVPPEPLSPKACVFESAARRAEEDPVAKKERIQRKIAVLKAELRRKKAAAAIITAAADRSRDQGAGDEAARESGVLTRSSMPDLVTAAECIQPATSSRTATGNLRDESEAQLHGASDVPLPETDLRPGRSMSAIADSPATQTGQAHEICNSAGVARPLAARLTPPSRLPRPAALCEPLGTAVPLSPSLLVTVPPKPSPPPPPPPVSAYSALSSEGLSRQSRPRESEYVLESVGGAQRLLVARRVAGAAAMPSLPRSPGPYWAGLDRDGSLRPCVDRPSSTEQRGGEDGCGMGEQAVGRRSAGDAEEISARRVRFAASAASPSAARPASRARPRGLAATTPCCPFTMLATPRGSATADDKEPRRVVRAGPIAVAASRAEPGRRRVRVRLDDSDSRLAISTCPNPPWA